MEGIRPSLMDHAFYNEKAWSIRVILGRRQTGPAGIAIPCSLAISCGQAALYDRCSIPSCRLVLRLHGQDDSRGALRNHPGREAVGRVDEKG